MRSSYSTLTKQNMHRVRRPGNCFLSCHSAHFCRKFRLDTFDKFNPFQTEVLTNHAVHKMYA